MSNKFKDKGTKAETRVVNFLLAAGVNAHRAVMKGHDDQGDIHVIGGDGHVSCILEVKGGKQTQNISRKQRDDWLAETASEAVHTGSVRGFLVIAKHGSSVCDYHVWSENGHNFWYLDEFVGRGKGGF